MDPVQLDSNEPLNFFEEEDEDEETLRAIDRGIRDADEGRLTPIEDVKKMIAQWT